MDHAEALAKKILVNKFGEEKVIYHEAQSNGEADFMVYDKSTRRYVEVTSATDSVSKELRAVIGNKIPQGERYFKSDKLNYFWVVRLKVTSKVKLLEKKIEKILIKVENKIDNKELICGDFYNYMASDYLCSLYQDNGIDSLSLFKSESETGYFLAMPSGKASEDKSKLMADIGREASKRDNIRKMKYRLGEEGITKPILMVFIDSLDNYSASFAFDNSEILEIPCELFSVEGMEIWVFSYIDNNKAKLDIFNNVEAPHSEIVNV